MWQLLYECSLYRSSGTQRHFFPGRRAGISQKARSGNEVLIAREKENAAGKLHPGDLAKRGRGLLAFLEDAGKKREPRARPCRITVNFLVTSGTRAAAARPRASNSF